MKLVAVDPGVKATGIALFVDNKLTHVTLSRATDLEAMIQGLFDIEMPVDFGYPDAVIIERPTVYRRGGKGDNNDLISVAIVAGAAGAAFGCGLWTTTEFVEPRTWKGSTPKKIHNERIVDQLNKAEREVLDGLLSRTKKAKVAKSLVHNVIDAIGVGLYKLGRM